MSSPPPPWESHPPLPGDEFYQADPDEDTGPLHVVAPTDEASHRQDEYRPPEPPAAEDTFAGRFTASLTIDPRTMPVRHGRIRPAPVLAGIAAVLAVGLAAWLLWPSSGGQAPSNDTAAPTTTKKPVDAEAQAKLLRFLPPGYPPDSCAQVDPPTGASARVDCTRNADADGPPSATYTLVRDKAALQAAFDGVVRGVSVVTCPGNIQSPGPWRRNATPQQVSGTLVCGVAQDRPTLAWTDDIALLLGVVRADDKGPTLDRLYAWWSSHS
jgi:serine/threonine kinase PknH